MRYILLVILNLPIILMALINIITQYKLGAVSRSRLRHQLIIWLLTLSVVVGSFPIYNWLAGKELFDSSELSLFDIVEVTAIIWLCYGINTHRQRLDQAERRVRQLHQELSIRLSESAPPKTQD